jgi:hypothetical protein
MPAGACEKYICCFKGIDYIEINLLKFIFVIILATAFCAAVTGIPKLRDTKQTPV